MNVSRVTPFVAIATASMLAALAVPVASQAAPQVVDVLASAQRPTRSELQALHGRYLLSDGSSVIVHGHGRRLVVDLGNGTEVALQARSTTRFGSADGRVDLVFEAAPNGVVERLRLTMPAASGAESQGH